MSGHGTIGSIDEGNVNMRSHLLQIAVAFRFAALPEVAILIQPSLHGTVHTRDACDF